MSLTESESADSLHHSKQLLALFPMSRAEREAERKEFKEFENKVKEMRHGLELCKLT